MTFFGRLFVSPPVDLVPHMNAVDDSCPCGAKFHGKGALAGINHRYWMEAHAVCRLKRTKPPESKGKGLNDGC